MLWIVLGSKACLQITLPRSAALEYPSFLLQSPTQRWRSRKPLQTKATMHRSLNYLVPDPKLGATTRKRSIGHRQQAQLLLGAGKPQTLVQGSGQGGLGSLSQNPCSSRPSSLDLKGTLLLETTSRGYNPAEATQAFCFLLVCWSLRGPRSGPGHHGFEEDLVHGSPEMLGGAPIQGQLRRRLPRLSSTLDECI